MIPCDHVGVAHPRHAALRADVGGHALQRHDRDGAGVLGDLRLLGGDHIHDHAALEHLGHPALHARGAQLGGGGTGSGRATRCFPLGSRVGPAGPAISGRPARAASDRFARSNGAAGPSIPPVDPPMVRQPGRPDPVPPDRPSARAAAPGPARAATVAPDGDGRHGWGLGDLEVRGRRGRAREPQPPHEPARAQVEGVADGVVVHAPGDQEDCSASRELGGEPGGQRVPVDAGEPAR